jgi:hypothetical protein
MKIIFYIHNCMYSLCSMVSANSRINNLISFFLLSIVIDSLFLDTLFLLGVQKLIYRETHSAFSVFIIPSAILGLVFYLFYNDILQDNQISGLYAATAKKERILNAIIGAVLILLSIIFFLITLHLVTRYRVKLIKF